HLVSRQFVLEAKMADVHNMMAQVCLTGDEVSTSLSLFEWGCWGG
ncbi:hypothetical protein scyTo_0023209, partial [Scyliorhinus torazame]|nr:hypothetical protein [Scyliorhinus torazame]